MNWWRASRRPLALTQRSPGRRWVLFWASFKRNRVTAPYRSYSLSFPAPLRRSSPPNPQGGGGGLAGLMGGMGGLMGLAAKLNGAGIDMSQIPKLGHEIFGYAEEKVGPEKLREIVDSIPGIAQFV